MSRVKLSSVVSRQLPEFVREDYPRFVSFIEAYYEFLQSQGVVYSDVRDLDKTLDFFIASFKKELSHNIPYIFEDERFFLQRIKDQYLAKGSEASYRLLFKLLFNKEVQLTYPGQQMLIASDGRWNQEVSVFVRVNFGDPEDIIGKIVEIQSFNKIIRVQVDKKQELTGEVERIVSLGNNIYELFLDRKFYGVISPGNTIKFEDKFQATILPTTSTVKIAKPGSGFRIGQIFELRSTTGTGTLIKVTQTDTNGGIKHAQIIKFGVGYIADFSSSILPSSSLSVLENIESVSSIFSVISTDNGPNLSPDPLGNPLAEERLNDFDLNIIDPFVKFDEYGFISRADYVSADWVDASWAGSIVKEFSTTAKNAAAENQNPAVIEINLNALARYPGYFESNNGFLSDSIFIQDSNYYQAFSYVTKIDERLDTYKSAVKTMIHPAGMALFGEYDISNSFNLEVEIESLIKSLGVSVTSSPIELQDFTYYDFIKDVTYESPDEVFIQEPTLNYHNNLEIPVTNITYDLVKPLSSNLVAEDPTVLKNIGKNFVETLEALDRIVVAQGVILNPESVNIVETVSLDPNKLLTDTASTRDYFFVLASGNNKYMLVPEDGFGTNEEGYVVVNGYEEGGYFSEIYANNRDSVFSS
jgi:hypothetical protein